MEENVEKEVRCSAQKSAYMEGFSPPIIEEKTRLLNHVNV
jgi:hypothetical protein